MHKMAKFVQVPALMWSEMVRNGCKIIITAFSIYLCLMEICSKILLWGKRCSRRPSLDWCWLPRGLRWSPSLQNYLYSFLLYPCVMKICSKMLPWVLKMAKFGLATAPTWCKVVQIRCNNILTIPLLYENFL